MSTCLSSSCIMLTIPPVTWRKTRRTDACSDLLEQRFWQRASKWQRRATTVKRPCIGRKLGQ